MSEIQRISEQLLGKLYEDFKEKGLSSSELENGYVGVSLPALKISYSEASVDFDLALKQLEGANLVDTGPQVPYKNEPGSGLFMVGSYSKRQYVYLTESGYKRAQSPSSRQRKSTSTTRVNISGGHFHNSNIGIGDHVQQQTKSEKDNTEVMQELLRLVREGTGRDISEARKRDVELIVSYAGASDLASAKPLFQKVFGVLGEGVKQAAWGVLTTLITKSMGF